MIREYAVQPDLLLDYAFCARLCDAFGVSRGRLVSRYPDYWEGLVYTAIADAHPIERKRIEEALAMLLRRMMARAHTWDEDLDWLANAINEHIARPFHAVLAQAITGGHRFLCTPMQLIDTNPLWHHESQSVVRRSAIEMTNAVGPLLDLSSEILFVDPNMQVNELRYRASIGAFLERIARRPTLVPIKRVEIHVSETAGTLQFIEDQCRQRRIVPAGIRLQCVQWERGRLFHNRYILTNRGGMSFGHGLDEGDGDDDVSLLSDSQHAHWWGMFQRPNGPLTLIGETTIA